MENPIIIEDSHPRSVVKGITWRITGTIDTMVMAFIITGHLENAIKIGLIEIGTKIFLYYLHERIWNSIAFGRIQAKGPTHLRSLVKGVSWRMVGTMDTMFIAFLVTGQPLSALKIGGLEVFSKIALYYLHERVWAKIKWGRIFKVSPSVSVQTQAEVPVTTDI